MAVHTARKGEEELVLVLAPVPVPVPVAGIAAVAADPVMKHHRHRSSMGPLHRSTVHLPAGMPEGRHPRFEVLPRRGDRDRDQDQDQDQDRDRDRDQSMAIDPLTPPFLRMVSLPLFPRGLIEALHPCRMVLDLVEPLRFQPAEAEVGEGEGAGVTSHKQPGDPPWGGVAMSLDRDLGLDRDRSNSSSSRSHRCLGTGGRTGMWGADTPHRVAGIIHPSRAMEAMERLGGGGTEG